MAKKTRKNSITPAEKKRRELRGYLDRLRRNPNPTPQEQDLMQELREALYGFRRPPTFK